MRRSPADYNNLTAGILVSKLSDGTTATKISSTYIGFEGYVTAQRISSLISSADSISAKSLYATILTAGTNFYIGNQIVTSHGVSFGGGSLKFTYLTTATADASVVASDLPHYHTVSFSNGQFTLGGVTDTAPGPFDVTATTWYKNQIAAAKNSVYVIKGWEDTEAIPGHKDGSRVSLTAGKTPARIAGIEVLDGAYAIGLDPLYNVTWDAEAHTGVYAIHECRDSEKLAGSITANYRDTGIVGGPIGSGWHYVKAFIRTKLGVLFPSIVDNGASSSTYYKSAFGGSRSSGVRAPWRFAALHRAGDAGLAAENGNFTPSNADWGGRPRLSGSGKKRGEWAA